MPPFSVIADDLMEGGELVQDENGNLWGDEPVTGKTEAQIGDVTYATVAEALKAAKPELAIPLYERFMDQCRQRGFRVEHGEFGADMKVASVNDGPVTILYDTDEH